MSSRLIEECFEIEQLEESNFNHWISLLIPSGCKAVIIDPYIINTADLSLLTPGKVGIVRVRRPGWGKLDIIGKSIRVLEL